MDFRWSALVDLWSQAIDVHEDLPLTRSAAVAALRVGSEDRRRRKLGIPSIFDPPPVVMLRRGSL